MVSSVGGGIGTVTKNNKGIQSRREKKRDKRREKKKGKERKKRGKGAYLFIEQGKRRERGVGESTTQPKIGKKARVATLSHTIKSLPIFRTFFTISFRH